MSVTIVKERIAERFNYFKSIGIKNVQELQKTLNKKDKMAELSKVGCLSGDYRTILLRELNSIHPKHNKIKEFVGILAKLFLNWKRSELRISLAYLIKSRILRVGKILLVNQESATQIY